MIDFLGRLMLVSIFLWSGFYNKPVHFKHVSTRIGALGLPFPSFLAGAAAALEIVGALVVLFPQLAGGPLAFRAAVVALGLYTMITALLFHPFWTHTGEARTGHLVNFLKNVGITGAFLLLLSR